MEDDPKPSTSAAPESSPRVSRTRKKSQPVTVPRSKRAGLIFPVGRCHRHMRDMMVGKRVVGGTAATYAAAAIEYVTAEMLELAGNICKQQNSNRLTPQHLQMAIKEDDELNRLVEDTIKVTGNDHWLMIESEDEEPVPSPKPAPRRSPRTKPKPMRKPPPKRNSKQK